MSGQRVGVAGDERLVGPIEALGCEAIAIGTPPFESVPLVIGAGEEAIVDLARARIDAPVLPVAVDGGFASVPFGSVEAALEYVLGSDPETDRHSIVEASGAFDPIPALFDIALMAAEPARISEFSVHTDDDLVSRFRADGVVVSTPAGSHGYNRRAGGPIVAAGTGVASIVPIAPFSTSAGHWVSPIDAVELAIERDETPVELLVDGRRERVIDTDESIELSIVGALETYTFPDLVSPRGGEKPLSP